MKRQTRRNAFLQQRRPQGSGGVKSGGGASGGSGGNVAKYTGEPSIVHEYTQRRTIPKEGIKNGKPYVYMQPFNEKITTYGRKDVYRGYVVPLARVVETRDSNGKKVYELKEATGQKAIATGNKKEIEQAMLGFMKQQ